MTEEKLFRAKQLDAEIRDAEEWLAVLDACTETPINLVALDTPKGRILWPLARDYSNTLVPLTTLRWSVNDKLKALRAELEAL